MNKRILYTLFFCLLLNVCCFSQTKLPFYEQLAFKFYAENILKTFPVEKKITVYKSLNYDSSEEIYYIPSDGLKIYVPKRSDSIKKLEYSKYWINFDDMSSKLDLDLSNIDKEKFKIKKLNKGDYPKLYVNYPKVYKDRIFVIIHEKYQNAGKYYTIEFNKEGKIVDWCYSKYTSITLH